MNNKNIENISFPCFIIEVKNRRIQSINKTMNKLLVDFYGENESVGNYLVEIMDIVISRLGENDAVTFSQKLSWKSKQVTLKYLCQYMGKDAKFIQVIVHTDMNNYIAPVDLSTFTEIIPSGLMLVEITEDNDYIAKYVNSGLHNMLGYTRKECETLFSHDILKFVHPEDIRDGLRLYHKQLSETGEFSLKGRLRHKNGSHIIVSLVGKLIIGNHEEKLLYCSVTDITETQDLLDKSFEGKQIYSIMENISRNILFKYVIKTKKISLYGFSLVNFLNKSFAEYEVDQVLENHGIDGNKIEKLRKNIEKGISEPFVINVKNIKNELRWLSFKYEFIHDKNGNNVSVIGQIEDVTQQMHGKIYYDKAIALWSIDANCDTQVAINLTQNSIVDVRSYGVSI